MKGDIVDLDKWGFVKAFDTDKQANAYIKSQKQSFLGEYKEYKAKPEKGRISVYVREKKRKKSR